MQIWLEGHTGERFSPLGGGLGPLLGRLLAQHVQGSVVDDALQPRAEEVPRVDTWRQHVHVPRPVDVQRRQPLQIRLIVWTVVQNEWNPILLVSKRIEWNANIFVLEHTKRKIKSKTKRSYILIFHDCLNEYFLFLTLLLPALEYFPVNTLGSHQNI